MLDFFTKKMGGRGAATLAAFVLGGLVSWALGHWRRRRQRRSILHGDARVTVVIEHHIVESAEVPGSERPGQTRRAPATRARYAETMYFLDLALDRRTAPVPTKAAVVEPTKAPVVEPTKASVAAAPTNTAAPAPTAAPTKIPAPAAVKDTLKVNTGAFPDNLDPQQSSFVNEIAHLQLAYEGLTRLDKDLNTVPAAAEKWAYNATATEVVFTLRKGLMYSDGSPLNAKRFEFSILRNVDPATAGEYAAITDDIAGAAAWRGADLKKATPDELAKLKAAVKVQAVDAAGAACKDYAQLDCLTLKIGLAAPAPYFHVVMGLWVTYPAKEEVIKAGGATWAMSAKNQIGNGPFFWQTLEDKQKSVFIPNTYYWGGLAKYNVEYRYITDGAVAFAAYKNNEFDVVGLAAEDLKTV
ncbi:MAG: ABC transporter substrate-binding protein, partial [Desulfobacterales bacterium]|nr:ABC transporter substrate-binding protein [Desulfobacterales bacterium]